MEQAAALPSTRTFRYWGKQGGGFFDPRTTKGCSGPNGPVFKGKKWKANYGGNSTPKQRHYTSLLRQNANARRRVGT